MIIIKKLFLIIFCTKDIRINLYKLNFLSYFSNIKCQQNNMKKITKIFPIPSLFYPSSFSIPPKPNGPNTKAGSSRATKTTIYSQ